MWLNHDNYDTSVSLLYNSSLLCLVKVDLLPEGIARDGDNVYIIYVKDTSISNIHPVSNNRFRFYSSLSAAIIWFVQHLM